MGDRTFARISTEVARTMLSRDVLVLIDVRDAAAYALGRIGSARRVSERDLYEVIVSTAKTRPILIYCYHGNSSQVYAQTFADFGFREVYSMDGGFERWREMLADEAADLPGCEPAP